MALVGWRVEWRSSFRDYEGVVIEHHTDRVVVWEYRDLTCYEWNPSQKDYKRWNPALKEFANYHRMKLLNAPKPLKLSEISRRIIDMIDSLENIPPMITAKKLAIQIETGKLQAALMDETEEVERKDNIKKSNDPEERKASEDFQPVVRKMVEFTLPENIRKQLWEEKHASDQESEEEEEDSEEEEDEDDDDSEDSDETSEQDEDSSDEDQHSPRHRRHGKNSPKKQKASSKHSESKEDSPEFLIDIKVMIIHTKQLRGFSVPLSSTGVQTMIMKLQEDYRREMNLFYRDEDGDIVNILSVDDLQYAIHCESKIKVQASTSTTSLKLKLFAEVTTPTPPPRTAEGRDHDRFMNTAAPTVMAGDMLPPPSTRQSYDRYGESPEPHRFLPNPTVSDEPPRTTGKTINFENNIYDIVWKKGEVLGVGSFGKVYSGVNVTTGMKMAIKEVYVHRSKNAKQQAKALQKEVAILSQLDHPNIIKYLGTEFSTDTTTLRIFLELANEGSLKDALREFGAFPEPLLRCYAYDIVQGLKYLHQAKIIHRDIKPANLLLSNGMVKLADFGCSSSAIMNGGQSGIETEHSTIAGTTIYMAPEVMQAGSEIGESDLLMKTKGESKHDDMSNHSNEPTLPRPPLDGEERNHPSPEEEEQKKTSVKYGRKADIWSLGMTLCELATGQPPYKNGPAAIFAVCISKQLPSFPSIFSDEAHDLLSRCLTYIVRDRADARELEQHPFMAPKTLEEVRAQTAASVSLGMTNTKNPHLASSVHLLPGSEQFHFSTTMEGPLRGNGDQPFSNPFEESGLGRSGTFRRRSQRSEGKDDDEDEDEDEMNGISYHGSNGHDSQFWTAFQQDEDETIHQHHRQPLGNTNNSNATPRMNHYASAPVFSTSNREEQQTIIMPAVETRMNSFRSNSVLNRTGKNQKFEESKSQPSNEQEREEDEEQYYEDDYESIN